MPHDGPMDSDQWRLSAKCAGIDTKLADEIFFPGSGGKATKADLFCYGCPVRSQCLIEATELRLEGFIAGTTVSERDSMRQLRKITVKTLREQYEEALPIEAKQKVRPVYRKYPNDFKDDGVDTLAYLDKLG